MSAWYQPLQAALDQRREPLPIFFRDDDGGWAQDRLDRLIQLFAGHRLPLDIAVIPAAVDDATTVALRAHRERHPARLGLHQHGYTHVNHEREGRKCEFGSVRTAADLRADVTAGRTLLAARFGRALDPVFTPPWNRCTDLAVHIIADLGFRVLSRDVTATPVNAPGLVECPTHIDWFAKRRGEPLTREAWVDAAARRLRGEGPVGLLLHHAVMDEGEFARLHEVLGVIARHPVCQPCALIEAAYATSVFAGAPELRS